ncbi:MAG: OmpA family protein [Alistipes sp.]|nr:OmpA family protein [Alistipes sp.]
MASKVRVYGKAQNRTALGIAHAYMVMYPQATLEDLRKAFPNELNPDKGVKENFVYAEDKGTTADWDGYFKAEEELLTMGDGKKVSVVKMWTKPSFERMVSHAKLYDIEIASFEAADKGGKKGGFRLEYLNGYVPPVAKKKRSLWWLWLLLILLLGGVAAFFALKPAEKEVVVEEKVVEVEKIVYIDRIEEIEKNFNAAKFEQGKAELSEDAKFVLHDLAKEMQKHPEVKLQIVGHTSAEGDAEVNQKLSEARAQAAVDFLVGHGGIAVERLEAVGKGSSEPLDANNLEVNRRTEFIIVE